MPCWLHDAVSQPTQPPAFQPSPLAVPSAKGWEERVIPWFVKHIREQAPFEGMLDPLVARNAQEILDAAKRSIATGREVRLRR